METPSYTYQVKKGGKYLLAGSNETIRWCPKESATVYRNVQNAYSNAEELSKHFGLLTVVRNETDAFGNTTEKTIRII